MSEEWRPVVGWEGLYEVSDQGRVRSLHFGRSLILKPRFRGARHVRVRLQSKGRDEYRMVHRLVAESFLPNPNGHPLVLHWDDDPENNRVRNLRWGTSSDNGLDAVRNNQHPQARKTHCLRGHLYDEQNTYYNPTSGGRVCRHCRRDDARNKYRETHQREGEQET